MTEYIFSYGSLMNMASRRTTLASLTTENSTDDAMLAFLSLDFGYRRAWCYRAATGFTALGMLSPENCKRFGCSMNESKPIPGVLFRVESSFAIHELDLREKGYFRINVPSLYISVSEEAVDSIKGQCIWMYVPEDARLFAPSPSFPILQTYLDVCLRGCLELGGNCLANNFLTTTCLWGEFWLNDAPLSRRPWLYRPDYQKIDQCLADNAGLLYFTERRHPEEFAATHLTAFSGLFGVPPRNKNFVGRETLLTSLHDRLHDVSNGSGISCVEITGVGGVGKTGLTLEYCHRYYGNTYGLVIFLNAETSASLASDLRRIAVDLGFVKGNQGTTMTEMVSGVESNLQQGSTEDEEVMGDEEVLNVMKAKLARCRWKWLLVFDNIEDPNILFNYLPRGLVPSGDDSTTSTEGGGHVIFTTRSATNDLQPHYQFQSLSVECFDETDSLMYLAKSLQEQSQDDTTTTRGWEISPTISVPSAAVDEQDQLKSLATRMGHLPLALSMAASYISMTDITVADYLRRLATGATANSGLEVALNVSLERIQRESEAAVTVLLLLGFLNPDGISKQLVMMLLQKSHFSSSEEHDGCGDDQSATGSLLSLLKDYAPFYAALCTTMASSFLLFRSRPPSARLSEHLALWAIVALASIGSASITQTTAGLHNTNNNNSSSSSSSFRNEGGSVGQLASLPSLASHSTVGEDIVETEANRVWDVLQRFQLLSVRGPRAHRLGSIHRLQQTALRGRCYAAGGVSAVRWQLEQLVVVLTSIWTFDPVNTSTWDDSSHTLVINHIQSLLEHVEQTGIGETATKRFVSLLVAGASFAQQVLSQFDVARSLLEAAKRLHETATLSACEEVSADVAHALGKVLRISGDFDEAMKQLTIALAWRQKSQSQKQADTLHELGVLHMRHHDTATALNFLNNSLELKQQLTPEQEMALETSLSATLYQLGIIRTTEGDLDTAESLLLQVLALVDADSTTNVVSRAATLQQLGRVFMRKGLLAEAESRLTESLDLYFTAYGREKASRHMNVAAVRHQLGTCFFSLRRFTEAAQQYTLALATREVIDATACTGNIEILHEVQALGQVEVELGQYERAEAHFDRQLTMCRQMILEMSSKLSYCLSTDEIACRDEISCRKSVGALIESMTPPMKKRLDAVMRSFLFAMNGLRGISKRKGDAARVSELKTQARIASRRFEFVRRNQLDEEDEGESQKEEVPRAPCEGDLIHRLCCLREKARGFARTLAKSNMKENDDGMAQSEASALIDEAKRAHHQCLARTFDANSAVGIEFIEKLVSEVSPFTGTSDAVPLNLGKLSAALFDCCDAFRSKLRTLGLVIVD